ncbi:hypothetical protein AGLY_006248 [Aphis glycines]|uniref:Uncharacterized protein n=1 Tax=Aphis glycines TaxID=307491 RepID=A0A6G0TSU2_APHGL|nr:hypothetical protein AGLY_006248 [Aphis glycines]
MILCGYTSYFKPVTYKICYTVLNITTPTTYYHLLYIVSLRVEKEMLRYFTSKIKYLHYKLNLFVPSFWCRGVMMVLARKLFGAVVVSLYSDSHGKFVVTFNKMIHKIINISIRNHLGSSIFDHRLFAAVKVGKCILETFERRKNYDLYKLAKPNIISKLRKWNGLDTYGWQYSNTKELENKDGSIELDLSNMGSWLALGKNIGEMGTFMQLQFLMLTIFEINDFSRYIPSHIGVPSNDFAEKLATKTARSFDRKYIHTEIHALKIKCRSPWSHLFGKTNKNQTL